MRWTGLLAVIAVLLAGCGSDEPFADRDPYGFEACTMLAASQAGEMSVEEAAAIGNTARRSATKDIRDTVIDAITPELRDALEEQGSGDAQINFADREDLREACEDEGFDF